MAPIQVLSSALRSYKTLITVIQIQLPQILIPNMLIRMYLISSRRIFGDIPLWLECWCINMGVTGWTCNIQYTQQTDSTITPSLVSRRHSIGSEDIWSELRIKGLYLHLQTYLIFFSCIFWWPLRIWGYWGSYIGQVKDWIYNVILWMLYCLDNKVSIWFFSNKCLVQVHHYINIYVWAATYTVYS